MDHLNKEIKELFKQVKRKEILPEMALEKYLELINTYEALKDIKGLEHILLYTSAYSKEYVRNMVEKHKSLREYHNTLNRIILLQHLGVKLSENDITNMLKEGKLRVNHSHS